MTSRNGALFLFKSIDNMPATSLSDNDLDGSDSDNESEIIIKRKLTLGKRLLPA